MFCQLFSLQNKSFLCLQHIENKGFQTVIKHRLKAIQKHIKNELGNREKKHKKCTFRFEKMHISFSRLYLQAHSISVSFFLYVQSLARQRKLKCGMSFISFSVASTLMPIA